MDSKWPRKPKTSSIYDEDFNRGTANSSTGVQCKQIERNDIQNHAWTHDSLHQKKQPVPIGEKWENMVIAQKSISILSCQSTWQWTIHLNQQCFFATLTSWCAKDLAGSVSSNGLLSPWVGCKESEPFCLWSVASLTSPGWSHQLTGKNIQGIKVSDQNQGGNKRLQVETKTYINGSNLHFHIPL